jgi:hypothetical protein
MGHNLHGYDVRFGSKAEVGQLESRVRFALTSGRRVSMSASCQKRKHWIGQLYFRLAGWAVFTVRNGLDHPI